MKKKNLVFLLPLLSEIRCFFFSSSQSSEGRCKIKDFMDYKRMMIMVILALIPTTILGIYNTGFQINSTIVSTGVVPSGIRYTIMSYLGLEFKDCLISNFVLGSLYFLPMYIVTLIVGGIIEVGFSIIRKKDINEGFLVTSLIFPLILPPGLDLWKVAVGIAFGIIFGKEVFGGTGKNIFNPALVGRIFLFFAYPASLTSNIWLDGTTGATYLPMISSLSSMDEVSFLSLFLGNKLGCIGETSSIACIIGGVFLIVTKISSLRIVGSCIISFLCFSSLFYILGISPITPMYHLVLGGFLFGIFFMAVDPVSACYTKIGKYIYGSFIGFLVIVIRLFNPAFPEGVMFAILLSNGVSPIIDHFCLKYLIASRERKMRVS